MASSGLEIRTNCYVVHRARSSKAKIYNEYERRWILLTFPVCSEDLMHCHASTYWIPRTEPADEDDEDFKVDQALNVLHRTHKPTEFRIKYLVGIDAWNEGCRNVKSLFITNHRAIKASDVSLAVDAFGRTTINLAARKEITRKGSPTTGGGFWETSEIYIDMSPKAEQTMMFFGPYEWIIPQRSNNLERYIVMDGGGCLFYMLKDTAKWTAIALKEGSILQIEPGTVYCFIATVSGLTITSLWLKNSERGVECLPDMSPPWDDTQNFTGHYNSIINLGTCVDFFMF